MLQLLSTRYRILLSGLFLLTLIMLFRTFVFSLRAVILPLLSNISEASTAPKHIVYTTITGYFQQDDPATNSGTFDYTKTNLGLINRPYDTDAEYDPEGKKTQWQRFEHQVFRLNRESGRKVQYKVLYMGRHGQGYHNAAESYYGTPAWDCYWSLKDGNGTITWDDAKVTPTGAAQAVIAHDFWASHLSVEKIPAPESYYTSPLSRCLETAKLTFSGLELPSRHPFVPVIKELFREAIGIHTCDRRNSKTYIAEHYPGYVFEEGFAETDHLWSPTLRETDSAEDKRLRIVLDDVFSIDDGTFISVTSHSGAISSILRVLGHQKFSLSTGAIIPVLVKAETVDGPAPTSSVAPYTTVSTCATPPPTPTPKV